MTTDLVKAASAGEGGGERRRPRARRPANKRSVARLAAVQALYQMDVTGRPADDVAKEFELFRLAQEIDGERLGDVDIPWFRSVLAGVVERQRAIDGRIDAALAEGWPLRRIDLTLRAVLRAGVFELGERPEVPARVAINEYVEVAKAFFSEDEPKIVNAVLDRIARDLRPEEFAGPTVGDAGGAG